MPTTLLHAPIAPSPDFQTSRHPCHCNSPKKQKELTLQCYSTRSRQLLAGYIFIQPTATVKKYLTRDVAIRALTRKNIPVSNGAIRINIQITSKNGQESISIDCQGQINTIDQNCFLKWHHLLSFITYVVQINIPSGPSMMEQPDSWQKDQIRSAIAGNTMSVYGCKYPLFGVFC